MSAPFKYGQTVYDRSGAKFEFGEALANERALVRPVMLVDTYDGGQEEYPPDAPAIVGLSELSPKPPVQAISAEVRAASDELAAIKGQAAEARQEIREQERVLQAAREAMAKLAPLRLVEDYVAGRITHFAWRASYGSKVEVLTFDEFMIDRGDRGRGTDIRLLSLFGDSKGNLAWMRNAYRDGSGSGWVVCQPCTSKEEAVAAATEMLEAIWAGWRLDPQQVWTLADSLTSAAAIGIDAPEDIAEAVRAYRIEGLRRSVTQAEADLETKRDALRQAGAA